MGNIDITLRTCELTFSVGKLALKPTKSALRE